MLPRLDPLPDAFAEEAAVRAGSGQAIATRRMKRPPRLTRLNEGAPSPTDTIRYADTPEARHPPGEAPSPFEPWKEPA